MLGFPEQSDRSHRTSGVEWSTRVNSSSGAPPHAQYPGAPSFLWQRHPAKARGWGRMVGVERPNWPHCGAGPVHVSVPVAWRADKAQWATSHAVFVYSVICSDGAPQAALQLSVGGGEPLEEGWGQGVGQHHHTPTRSTALGWRGRGRAGGHRRRAPSPASTAALSSVEVARGGTLSCSDTVASTCQKGWLQAHPRNEVAGWGSATILILGAAEGPTLQGWVVLARLGKAQVRSLHGGPPPALLGGCHLVGGGEHLRTGL